MVPMRFVFRSRWAALLWAGGICWTAISFAGGNAGGLGIDASNSGTDEVNQAKALIAEDQ